jgi:hypothetical protein
MKVIYKSFFLLTLVFLGGYNFVFAEESTEEVVEEPKTSCEYFDYTLINLFTLEIASQETKQKIEKVEDTIDDETIVRSTILGSLKNLLGLRQTDKVIFREMKKEIADAKAYYENIDQKVVITGKYLDDNFCENTKIEKAVKVSVETENMVEDEEVFRKQFASSLKDKMKIIQEEVENAKK